MSVLNTNTIRFGAKSLLVIVQVGERDPSVRSRVLVFDNEAPKEIVPIGCKFEKSVKLVITTINLVVHSSV